MVAPVSERNILTAAFLVNGCYAVTPLAAIALSSVVILGRKRLTSGMPVAGSCSAAISAVCYTREEEEPHNTIEKLLQWGAFAEPNLWNNDEYCGFSSLEVEPPVEGQVYEGWVV